MSNSDRAMMKAGLLVAAAFVLPNVTSCGREVLVAEESAGRDGDDGDAAVAQTAASWTSVGAVSTTTTSAVSGGGAQAGNTGGPVSGGGGADAGGGHGLGGDGGGAGSGGGGGDPPNVGGTGGGSGGGDGGAGAAGVLCGEETCFGPGYCFICDPTGEPRVRSCGDGFDEDCGAWGRYPPLRMLCDGHADCATGEVCSLLEGSLGTYTDCWAAPDCLGSCDGCAVEIVCETLADCPPCAGSCVPYIDPAYPVSVCGR